MQTPDGECALLECLRVWGDAGVRIGFRGGQYQISSEPPFGLLLFCALLLALCEAVPEAQIAFPRFEVASCLRDDGERLTRLTLQRGDSQRP